MADPSDSTEKRRVGRPRHLDDEAERRAILDAAYTALRDRGHDFTIADILAAAGMSTRSLYRHFESKDALLCAMYRRDAEWVAERLDRRLADATSPVDAVRRWIDEIFRFVLDPRRAERVSVLGSITGSRADGVEAVAIESRALLVEPLRAAVAAGVADSSFTVDDVSTTSDLVAAAVLHAAGLATPFRAVGPHDPAVTTAFCLRALGHDRTSG